MNPLSGNFILSRKMVCLGLALVLVASTVEARKKPKRFGCWHAMTLLVFTAGSVGAGYVFSPEGYKLPDKNTILPDYLIEYDLVHADGTLVKETEVLAKVPVPKKEANPLGPEPEFSKDDTEDKDFLYYLHPARLVPMQLVQETQLALMESSYWFMLLKALKTEDAWKQDAWDSYLEAKLWPPLRDVFNTRGVDRNSLSMSSLYKPLISACLGFESNSKLGRLRNSCYLAMHRFKQESQQLTKNARSLKATYLKGRFVSHSPIELPEFGLWSDRRMARLEREQYCFTGEKDGVYQLTLCSSNAIGVPLPERYAYMRDSGK